MKLNDIFDKFKKIFKNKYRILIIALFILAVFFRLSYVIKFDYKTNQHDIEPNGNGLSYIYEIYINHQLPQNNNGQNYHPPFNQIILAISINIINVFTNNYDTVNESLQFVILIYSILLWIGVYKIVNILKLNDRIKLLIMSIISFNPTLIILSGSLNSDSLCLTLSVWVMYYLIKWYQDNKNINNTIVLAVLTGLTVMTKSAGALISLPIAFVFIVKFVIDFKTSNIKKKTFLKYFWMFLFFGVVSLPIGLWYNIRNYFLFEQPILYVFNTNNLDLYVGDYSIIQRFLSFSINGIRNIYCDPWTEYNIPSYLIKNSLFGEFKFNVDLLVVYYFTIIMNIINFLISFILILYSSFVKKGKEKELLVYRNAFLILLLFNCISYITTNYKLPYGCTMDFRYLIYGLIASVILIGIDLNVLDKKIKNKVINNILFGIFVIVNLIVNVCSVILILL